MVSRNRPRRLAFVPAFALLVAGCASGTTPVIPAANTAEAEAVRAGPAETAACSSKMDQVKSAAIGGGVGGIGGTGLGKLAGKNWWIGTLLGVGVGAATGYGAAKSQECPSDEEVAEQWRPKPLVEPAQTDNEQ
jgi:hypothetical protein